MLVMLVFLIGLMALAPASGLSPAPVRSTAPTAASVMGSNIALSQVDGD
jgi:hypothetical protein